MAKYARCFLRWVQRVFLVLSLALGSMVGVSDAIAVPLAPHAVATLNDTAQGCTHCVSSEYCEQCWMAHPCCTLAVLRHASAPVVLCLLHDVVYVAMFRHFQQADVFPETPPPK